MVTLNRSISVFVFNFNWDKEVEWYKVQLVCGGRWRENDSDRGKSRRRWSKIRSPLGRSRWRWKKTQKLGMTTESTEDEDERIPKTPEVNLNKESSTPEQTMVIPPKDLSSRSSHEEARTSDINANISHTDVNVNIGEIDSNTDAQAKVVSKVSGIVRDSESRILEKADHNDQNIELRVNSLNSTFLGEVKELKRLEKD
ncbi:unnamed protein product [Lactuca saligna]|uniref:Uncharacterized protein n=1 Tax=Lactuca saligna TaxID=75948 RepID=A0AA36A384_LACSI|nr:unnamed protein product [Lactuca saligna]